MTIEIKAPTLPESVPDGTIATWYKKPGESVSRDELLVDIETDKVVLEVVAPADGVLKDVKKGEGDTIVSNEVLAIFAEGETGTAPSKPAAEAASTPPPVPAEEEEDNSDMAVLMSPAARKLVDENDLDANQIQSTGKDGRVTKEDVVNYMKAAKASADTRAPAAEATSAPPVQAQAKAPVVPAASEGGRAEQRVPMTRLRAKVAERLLQATQTTAMLTTFNEVNMQEVMSLRNRYKDAFEKQHNGTRLGFMSFLFAPVWKH